jgi:hypothetical protein
MPAEQRRRGRLWLEAAGRFAAGDGIDEIARDLRVYALDLNPAEGIWSLLKRAMANFAAAGLNGLVRIVKRKAEENQYRPHLIDGCLAATGLKIEPW